MKSLFSDLAMPSVSVTSSSNKGFRMPRVSNTNNCKISANTYSPMWVVSDMFTFIRGIICTTVGELTRTKSIQVVSGPLLCHDCCRSLSSSPSQSTFKACASFSLHFGKNYACEPQKLRRDAGKVALFWNQCDDSRYQPPNPQGSSAVSCT